MNPTFVIDEFPYTPGIIELPTERVWFRASEAAFPLSDHVNYYSDADTAQNYLNDQRTLCAFKNARPLKLLDIRFLHSIMPHIMSSFHNWNEHSLTTWKNLTLTLGCCSLATQLELLREVQADSRYPENVQGAINAIQNALQSRNFPDWINPIEPQGGRMGITDMDYRAANILKDMFGDVCDGILSPRLNSMYHHDTNYSLHPEMLLFNPVQTLVQLPEGDMQFARHSLNAFLRNSHATVLSFATLGIVLKGGGKQKRPRALADRVHAGIKTALSEISSVRRMAKSIIHHTRMKWPILNTMHTMHGPVSVGINSTPIIASSCFAGILNQSPPSLPLSQVTLRLG